MPSVTKMATDLVEELRLRRWAREHYVPAEKRDGSWHPVVIEEMASRDREIADEQQHRPSGQQIVPLMPDFDWRIHGPHIETTAAPLRLRVPDLDEMAR